MATKSRPAPVRSDTEESSDIGLEAEQEDEQQALTATRNRSQSRRRRRQRQKGQHAGASANANALSSVQEEGGRPQANAQADASAKNGILDRVGGDEDSMTGPVTYARQERGDIPMHSGAPQQAPQKKDDDDEGLRLKLELNLEVEVELKASLRGDLTIGLLQ